MCSPSRNPLPPPSASHHSGSSQCTSPEHPVSCMEPGLAIVFTYDNIHVSMSFSQITIPSPSLSPKDCSIHLSLLLFQMQGYRYHLSKLYMYIYICISILYWQIWPWNTEWSREKTNRVLPRKWTGHTNTLFQQHKKTLNMGITRWSTPKFDYILCSQRWRSCLYSQQKQDQELTVAHNMNSLLQNSNLNWRV